jgi:hypothetical protein
MMEVGTATRALQVVWVPGSRLPKFAYRLSQGFDRELKEDICGAMMPIQSAATNWARVPWSDVCANGEMLFVWVHNRRHQELGAQAGGVVAVVDEALRDVDGLPGMHGAHHRGVVARRRVLLRHAEDDGLRATHGRLLVRYRGLLA